MVDIYFLLRCYRLITWEIFWPIWIYFVLLFKLLQYSTFEFVISAQYHIKAKVSLTNYGK